MTRRRLTPEEVDLWHLVASRTDRMHPAQVGPPRPLPKPTPTKPAMPRITSFQVGQAAAPRQLPHDLKPSLPERLHRAPIQMDRKAYGRMKRGKLAPEGRIDLHGLTLDRAHPALIRFILTAQSTGKRLVLVITGKGKKTDQSGPIPAPFGVLRHNVPHWLETPPLAQAILQVTPAHFSHGGTGAYYVYLRRGR